MFRKKISPSDELFLHFSSKVQESDRVFNYLHDSNSIFRAGGIKSEWVRARTVSQLVLTSGGFRVDLSALQIVSYTPFTGTYG